MRQGRSHLGYGVGQHQWLGELLLCKRVVIAGLLVQDGHGNCCAIGASWEASSQELELRIQTLWCQGAGQSLLEGLYPGGLSGQ